MADAEAEPEGSEEESKRKFREALERKRAKQADGTGATGGKDAGKVHGAGGLARAGVRFAARPAAEPGWAQPGPLGADVAVTHILVVADPAASGDFWVDVLGAEPYREYGGTSVVSSSPGPGFCW